MRSKSRGRIRCGRHSETNDSRRLSSSVTSASVVSVTWAIVLTLRVMRSAMILRRPVSGTTSPTASARAAPASRSAMARSTSTTTTRPPGPEPVTSARSMPSCRASILARGTTWTCGRLCRASMASRTSCSVIRPRGPVPVTSATSRPLSRASRLATGVTWEAAPPVGRASLRRWRLRAPADEVGAPGSGRGGFSPGSPMTATSAPTLTSEPSAAMMCDTTPEAGDSSSELILAVSTSTSGCPSSISSPSLTSHLVSVPSSMFMPHWGSSTLVAMIVPCSPYSRVA